MSRQNQQLQAPAMGVLLSQQKGWLVSWLQGPVCLTKKLLNCPVQSLPMKLSSDPESSEEGTGFQMPLLDTVGCIPLVCCDATADLNPRRHFIF